jgi:hypothetical protein
MKTSAKITQEQLETLCWAFHKWWRSADAKNDIAMIKAIDGTDDKEYGQAMQDSLEEIGIKVVKG